MDIKLRELLEVPAEDVLHFGIASALISCVKYDDIYRTHIIRASDEPEEAVQTWGSVYSNFRDWFKQGYDRMGLVFVFSEWTSGHGIGELIAVQFMVHQIVTNGGIDQLLRICDSDVLRLNSMQYRLAQFALTGKEQMLAVLGATALKQNMNQPRCDEDLIAMFCFVIAQQVGSVSSLLVASIQDEHDKARRLQKKLTKAMEDNSALESALNSARNKPPVIKEVPVPDTEKEELLYEELQVLTARLALLEDKIAAYEAVTPEGDFETAKEIYEEQLEEIDLSGYKILIVGSEENKDAYPFPYIECKSNTDILQKLKYVDFVLFDTRYNSHHTYFSVKNICKASGVKMFHINNRNKDIILSETKRLISACR